MLGDGRVQSCLAAEKGASAYIGDGINRWPVMHQLDAVLYRLVLEDASTGATFHGAAEEDVPFRDLAAVISHRRNVPVVSTSPEQTASISAGSHASP